MNEHHGASGMFESSIDPSRLSFSLPGLRLPSYKSDAPSSNYAFGPSSICTDFHAHIV
jgi:hypothetical protein